MLALLLLTLPGYYEFLSFLQDNFFNNQLLYYPTLIAVWNTVTGQ